MDRSAELSLIDRVVRQTNGPTQRNRDIVRDCEAARRCACDITAGACDVTARLSLIRCDVTVERTKGVPNL
jgi:hypothetical protein